MTRILTVAAIFVMLCPTLSSAESPSVSSTARIFAALSPQKQQLRMSPRPNGKQVACLYYRCGNPGESCCPEGPRCVCSQSECQCR
jgi:hypothetical protein